MISVQFAIVAICISLLVTILAYVRLSKIEGSYINVLLPSLLVGVPAYYIFPWAYALLFGTEASQYAFLYVYATLTVEIVAFVYGYARARQKVVRLPLRFSYCNFGVLAWICLGLAALIYAPVLLEFREYLLDPRAIYTQTRTGFGQLFFVSTTLAYLAVIFILFTKRSLLTKATLVTLATALVLLHGSKGQVLNIILILALFQVYVRGRKFGLKGALIAGSAVAVIMFLLFAATMFLGEGARDALEAISGYSDYTRNAMMVIDEHFPIQYGRLTVEANIIGIVPRVLMPNKPKNFGPMRLDEEFYPQVVDADVGAPAFGVGIQYADFGDFAIVYIALFSALRGWLTRVFVNRLRLMGHPADFLMLAFLADIGIFPIGVGWLFPEAILLALLLRFVSRVGANKSFVESRKLHTVLAPSRIRDPLKNAESC